MTTEQEKLVEDNLRLVTFLIQKHYPGKSPLGDFGDVFQVGCIGLCKAAQTYKPEKGFTFSTYAAKCIRNEIRRELRTLRASTRAPEGGIVSLDKCYGEEDTLLLNLVPDPGADIEHQLEIQERYRDVIKAFEDEPVLFAVATQQMTQSEAADLLGMSQPNVCRKIKAIISQHMNKEDNHDQDQHECGSQLP